MLTKLNNFYKIKKIYNKIIFKSYVENYSIYLDGNRSRNINLQFLRTLSTNNVEQSVKTNMRKIRNSQINIYGQPTPQTHPHLLKQGELIQGITLNEIKNRRIALMNNIQKFALNLNQNLHNHIVVIPSSTKKYMSDKIPYVFRQNSDFLYLTGCLEPDSVLVMFIDNENSIKSILFVRPKDKYSELWEGIRTGVDAAPEFYGVDESYPIKQFSNYIDRYMATHKTFSFWYDKNSSDLPEVTNIVESCLKKINPNTSESPITFIHKLRVIKSPSEIKLMRKTCEIASESINRTISESKPGDSEHHLFARVDYNCRMKNANFLAYPPVVASGKNATTIHYINNCQIINNGDLVLMDAGCEYGGYCSDITRTWPINGQFTPTQKVLYEILCTIQKELINTLLKDGGKTLDDLFDTMCLKLGIYLQEIGIIPKELAHIDLAKMAYSFCPHHVSHYLGMDVHDTSTISRSLPLQPGMVCTVEPGIYIAADRHDVPEEFRGIGIRIEDDILISSDTQVEVLTEKCIKEPKKLENLIRN